MHCSHVDVRTTPQSCFVFTLRTHPAVLPGTIAFNAPQVSTVSILVLPTFGISHFIMACSYVDDDEMVYCVYQLNAGLYMKH